GSSFKSDCSAIFATTLYHFYHLTFLLIILGTFVYPHDLARNHINEEIPVPRGITSEDINSNAPRLFSDNLFVPLLKLMVKTGLQFYARAYADSSRHDLRKFFRDAVDRLLMHNQQAAELMEAKGTPVPPPYIPVPDQVDFIKKQNFMTGFFKNKRPLTALEINNIFFNAQANALGKALLLGFSQVARSTEIKEFIIKGKNFSNKYFTDLNKILLNQDITVPPSYDGEVTDSTESPFSDRMILFYTVYMNSVGLQRYGLALSMIQRHDLTAMFAKMIVETGSIANDGAKLMINNGWMEQPPLAPDRDALIKQGKKSTDERLH
ncbi:MAG: DUF3231 family protein, partial [Desulfotomaculaceae bacterium]|nr:DUF3231 family protein [Desulfotomaculaceae bacterium]